MDATVEQGSTGRARARAKRGRHGKLYAASLAASSIEWYDFFLFATAAALIFPHVFFPESTPLTGTLLSFSTFWAGFLARPVGGVAAGHFGDRYGRKPVVVVSLLFMAAATVLLGALPSASTIGGAAPILLVVLRFVQGLACGGQWGGVVVLLTESAPKARRGFAGTFGQVGISFGALFGNLAFIIATAALSQEAFQRWGWRLPFLASAVLFPVVLFIHKRVEDSPEFRELQAESGTRTERAIVQAPLAEAIRSHWRTILLACGILAGANAIAQISGAGVLSYGATQLGLPYKGMLVWSLINTVITIFVVVGSGWVSDRIGRRPVIITGAIGTVLWAFPYFWLVDTGSLPAFSLALIGAGLFQSMIAGAVAAYFSELFAPHVRLSGASLAYQLAAIVFSGGTPFLMTWIVAESGGATWVSAFIAALGVITLICVLRLPETSPARARSPHETPRATSTPSTLDGEPTT